MDLSTEELLSRKETLKQFENYIDQTRNTLKCFVEKIGWTLDKTPKNVNIQYLTYKLSLTLMNNCCLLLYCMKFN